MYNYVYAYKFKTACKNNQPVVLVTGCSSGIGLAISRLLVDKEEYKIILTTREKSIGILKNEIVENERIWILPLDVADETSRLNLIKEVNQRWGGIDILVNNAGICYRSVLEEMLDRDELLQMTTNYLGPVSLIRHLLPRMRKNGWGKIINVSSVSGMLAVPTMASYSASKFALEGAMEALWYETRPFGIDVSLVQPGFVKSNSFERVKYSIRSELSNKLDRPYSNIYKNMVPFIAKLMGFGLSTPESIAKLIYNVMRSEKPPLWIPASLDAEFFYYLKRMLPRRLILPFFYWLMPGSNTWGPQKKQEMKESL